MLDECVLSCSRYVWSLPHFLPIVLQKGSCRAIPGGSSLIGRRRTCRPGSARKGCRISWAPSQATTSTERSSAGSTRTRPQSWELVRPGTQNAVTNVSAQLTLTGTLGFNVPFVGISGSILKHKLPTSVEKRDVSYFKKKNLSMKQFMK